MDLYAILGIARSASGDDVERAYRRLARRYHPGLNPGDREAAERFRQVEQAYRVLADEAERQAYDRQGPQLAPAETVEATIAFSGFDFSSAADGSSAATFSELFADVFQDAARRATATDRGLPIDVTLALTFLEAVHGGVFPVTVPRQEHCVVCNGHGWTTTAPARCPDCSGTGVRRSARGHMVFTKTCERCDGQGHLNAQTCRGCGGVGVHAAEGTIRLTVPAGVETGARLVVPGAGHAVRGGPSGDLYVTVDVAPHPLFQRSGRDLSLTLPVAVHEAALGARVDVPTLASPVKMRLPAGTSSGEQFRLRGQGLPSADGDPARAGDLLVEIQIVVPSLRDERSKALMKEFGRLNDGDVRKHLFEES